MKTVIASDELSAKWKSIIDDAKKLKEELAPNETTKSKFMEETGMTRGEIDGFISKLVKADKIEIVYKTVDGHRQKIIRLK